ncbi:ribosome small subunit-dependent GTPase A [Enterococcus faecium]|nr:ribosome small subunit-dependent GTPase A [Enterococcus faecium]
MKNMYDINKIREGLITSVHKDLFGFSCQEGEGFAEIKRGNYFEKSQDYPTVGDLVELDYQGDDHSLILRTLPRKSFFMRLDSASNGNSSQLVAANFDYVFIMQSLERDFNLRRLERYLTLAWESGGIPVVLLTKVDQVKDYLPKLVAAERIAIGTNVHVISAVTGEGLTDLQRYLQPKSTIVLLGSSGVGKSTLLNRLAGKDIMTTHEIRERDQRGRHTTSYKQLITLSNGTQIIDTPGMRELGMWESSSGLSKSFSDIEDYLGKCQFADCHHQNEPNCAIKTAIREGKISLERWESYLKLSNEIQFVENKDDYLREKNKYHKKMTMMMKNWKKVDYRIDACVDSFICENCGKVASSEGAGSKHRNHCPHCLTSKHVDTKPGDRASLCQGLMEPISIWVKDSGEWSIIHRCNSCGSLKSNRIAADDDKQLLTHLAYKPIINSSFPISE